MNKLSLSFLLSFLLLLGVSLSAQEPAPVAPSEPQPVQTEVAPAETPTIAEAPVAVAAEAPAVASPEAQIVEAPASVEAAPTTASEPAVRERRSRTRTEQVVRIGESYRVRAGERIGDTVIIGASLTVEEGGRIDGDAVVIMGEVRVEGQVSGNLVSVMGTANLGDAARIDGDFVAIGASEVGLGAVVKGEKVEVGLGANRIWYALQRFLQETILLGRPWSPNLGWMWVLVIASLGMAFFIALIFDRSYRKLVQTAGERPAMSIGAGLLTMVAIPPVCLILLAIAVGVLIVPLVMIAVFGATVVGMAAIGALLGRSIGLRTDSTLGYAVATLAGCALGFALLAIPFLGIPLLALLTLWGLGATTLAAWGGMQSRTDNTPPAAPTEPSRFETPVTPVAPAPTAASQAPQAMGFAQTDTLRPTLVSEPQLPQTSGAPAPEVPPAAAPAGEVFTQSQSQSVPPAAFTPPAPPPAPPLPPIAPQAAQGFVPLPSAAERRAARLAETEGRVAFWPRAGAVILDVILVGMTLGIFTVGEAAFPVFFVAYCIGMWVWKGTTIGGAVMRLRVQRVNGDELSFGTALVRALVSILSLVSLGIGWFWASSRERQGWQDIVAGTVVVRLKPGVSVF